MRRRVEPTRGGRTAWLPAARLVYALVCVLVALLAVVPAPTYRLWQASIPVTELGWIVAAAALPVFLPGFWRTWAGRGAAVLAGAAIVLALSPLARAAIAAEDARAELARSFWQGRATPPFQLQTAFTGTPTPAVTPTTHEYVRDEDGPRLLDVYRPPAGDAARPLVVIVHGGSWRTGDRQQLPGLGRRLADRYVVAALEYRLAPEHTFPAAVDDVARALSWLKHHADTLGIDTTRIVLLGRSAGGQLALLAAYTLRDPAIRGVISFYGPTDLRWGWEHPTNPRVLDSRAVLRDYIGGTLEERGDAFDRASPLRFATTAVPTLLVHGGRDELVSPVHARRLADALRARAVPHAYVRLPWATHGCDYIARGPCGQISSWAVERFLASIFA